MSDTLSHVKPEPQEAPEPQPRRIYTLADHRSRVAGWQHLAHHHNCVIGFGQWCEAIDVVDAVRAQARTAAGGIR